MTFVMDESVQSIEVSLNLGFPYREVPLYYHHSSSSSHYIIIVVEYWLTVLSYLALPCAENLKIQYVIYTQLETFKGETYVFLRFQMVHENFLHKHIHFTHAMHCTCAYQSANVFSVPRPTHSRMFSPLKVSHYNMVYTHIHTLSLVLL